MVVNGDKGSTTERDQIARSVYVHVPFCRHRCGYCNFSVVAGRDHLVDDYLKAIEIELSAITIRQTVDTIYLGGGTPSRLSREALLRLLELLSNKFELAVDGEFTIEANPEDLNSGFADIVNDSPINRISLGIQSFDQQKLRSLDRDHSSQQIEEALSRCLEIVERISIDLIFAAPHDCQEVWREDLRRGVDSGAGHISTYELTYEKGTSFWNQRLHGQLRSQSDDACADFYEETIDVLTGNGFEHYEISSFAKAGHRSRHNQVYWQGMPYLAFGPGASGFIDGNRYTNDQSVGRYLKKVLAGESSIVDSQQMTPRAVAMDQLVFGLRLVEGIDSTEFSRRTGFELLELVSRETIDRLVEFGFIEETYLDRLKLTKKGLLAGDYVCSEVFDL